MAVTKEVLSLCSLQSVCIRVYAMFRGIYTILHGPWLTVKHTTLAYTFSFEYVMGSQIKRERPKKPSHSHTLLYVFVFVGFYICAYGDWGFIFHLDGSIWVHILSLVSLWSKTSASLCYVTIVVCFVQA